MKATDDSDMIPKKTIDEMIEEENLEYMRRVKDKRKRANKEWKEFMQQTMQENPPTQE